MANAFDVAIIPYRLTEQVLHANPLKLREYLATGKPVVAVSTPVIEQFADYVHIASSQEEFLSGIEQALAHDTESKKIQRMNAVADMSWDRRADDAGGSGTAVVGGNHGQGTAKTEIRSRHIETPGAITRRPTPIPRVVHIVDSLEIGGLERLVHDLAIARGGGDLTSVACLCALGPFGEALRNRGIQVELIGTEGGFVPTLWRLWKHVRHIKPDLIHCHNLFSFLNGCVASRLAGNIPVVMTKHGASVPGNGLGSQG